MCSELLWHGIYENFLGNNTIFSYYRSDDIGEEEQEQWCALEPHYVKKISKY
jgi:hypothetical protein